MKIIFIILFFISSLMSSSSNMIDDRTNKLKSLTYTWNTNWKKHSILYSELLSGGPPRDGIPAIYNPKFTSIKNASSWIKNKEPLIFVKINNKTKAYPLQVLIWHEIVNDTLDKQKILVTFCPLCNASIVFSRIINGKEYTFGTSGLLRHSDLVMYDKESESLWQQFTGNAIVGDMLDSKLTPLVSSIISFEDIKHFYPNTKILSKDTGYNRAYGKNPYSGYDDISSNPFLLDTKVNDKLPAMRRVATIEINNKTKAYSYKILENKKVINDIFESKKLVLFYKKEVLSVLDDSQIKNSQKVGSSSIYESTIDGFNLEFYYDNGFFDKQTKSHWNIFGQAISGPLKGKQLKEIVFGSHFWFAWAVFKPDTIIYKNK